MFMVSSWRAEGVHGSYEEAPTEPEVQTQGVISPLVSVPGDAEGGGAGGCEQDWNSLPDRPSRET